MHVHVCARSSCTFPFLLRLLPFVGFEESGVSDAEGLLAMMHHRYPDVREGEGGGIVHVM